QAVDRVVGAVFALAPHFVVEESVLVRLHILAALEVESQEYRGAFAARPADEMVVVIFLEHGVSLKTAAPNPDRPRRRNLHPRAGPRRAVAAVPEQLLFRYSRGAPRLPLDE